MLEGQFKETHERKRKRDDGEKIYLDLLEDDTEAMVQSCVLLHFRTDELVDSKGCTDTLKKSADLCDKYSFRKALRYTCNAPRARPIKVR